MVTSGHLEVTEIGNVTVVTFVDSVLDGKDDTLIIAIGEELFELARQGKNYLLLDLSGVTFMAALMVGKLVSLKKRHLPAHGKLVICNVHPDIFEDIDEKRFAGYLGVFKNASREAALKFF